MKQNTKKKKTAKSLPVKSNSSATIRHIDTFAGKFFKKLPAFNSFFLHMKIVIRKLNSVRVDFRQFWNKLSFSSFSDPVFNLILPAMAKLLAERSGLQRHVTE